MERKLHKVKGYPTLRKDPYSKAVLNVDLAAAQRHATREAALVKESHREAELSSMRSEIQELKDLIRQLVARDGNRG